MSQPLASSSMSNPYPTIAPSSNHQVIIESALKEYQKTTKQDLTAHPLATRLQACETLPAILIILQDQIDGSNQSRSSDERMSNWLDPTISVLHAFSTTLGEGVCSGFTPANAIYAGIGILLLAAAKDVEASQGGLIDLFECIKHFFQRLEPYTNVPPTVAMTDMMMHIMVEVLGILGTATKQMQQGKASEVILQLRFLEAHE
ncbi:hypothetical protein EI94DRAFT_1698457 [Lactarius quietus]|nr:hypothetical protein EI94DRAFT_1698457 [Lactarius quietus]